MHIHVGTETERGPHRTNTIKTDTGTARNAVAAARRREGDVAKMKRQGPRDHELAGAKEWEWGDAFYDRQW